MASTITLEEKQGHRSVGNGHGKRPNSSAGSRDDSQMTLVSREIERLVEASQEGRLHERARSEQFQGVYRDAMKGINTTLLDAILLPIGEGNRILAQISSRQD